MNGQSIKSQEFRLGLVMYGGVSLAVYINGVAREFFRAVRGQGVYKLIKAFTDSDIQVDIISGTSAGGINGILLGYALCNQCDFASCATLWRQGGNIAQLLRSHFRSPDETNSILNSQLYQARLEEAFRSMLFSPPGPDEDASPLKELDLFVTGTDVDGRVFTWFDDMGHPIDVKDHRTVFLLKHREGRKRPFDPYFFSKPAPGCEAPDAAAGGHEQALADPETTYKALAKLARITSCFPVAFQPVHVSGAQQEEDPEYDVDGKLRIWGNFRKETFYLDGGVLDNKPFTYTIREIYYRMADRKVDRRLFYVEPDPECFVQHKVVHEPSIVQAALKSLVSIPSYESISDDLKLLNEHNDKVIRYKRLAEAVRRVSRDVPEATERFIERMHLRETASPGAIPPPGAGGERECLYGRCRLAALSERAVRGILKARGHDSFLEEPAKRAAASALYESLQGEVQKWPGGTEETLYNFDVSFRLRRLFHLLYRDEIYEAEDAGWRQEALHGIGRLVKILEIAAAAMERLVDDAPIHWQDGAPERAWRETDTVLKRLLNTAGEAGVILNGIRLRDVVGEEDYRKWFGQEELSRLNAALQSRADCIILDLEKSVSDFPAPTEFESFFRHTDALERELLRLLEGACPPGATVQLLEMYDAFARLDSQLFLLESFADLDEKDRIETVRISPRDARKGFSRIEPKDKVAGDVLHHFGGFFKKSWRSNDILWGRLDGLCQLVETLFDPQRLRDVLEDPALRNTLRSRLQHDLHPAVLFPGSGEPTWQVLLKWFGVMLSDDQHQRETVLARGKEFDEHLELLIEAAQLEILPREIEGVIGDAVEQQAEWNHFILCGKTPEENTKEKDAPAADSMMKQDMDRNCLHVSGEGHLDPLVMTAAAEELARRAVKGLEESAAGGTASSRPGDTPLGRFFRQKYAVGKESLWNDVPLAVLLDIFSKVLLVLRNGLVRALGAERAASVKSNPLYTYVSLILWTFRGVALFPKMALWQKLALIVGAVVFLIVFSACSWEKVLVAAVVIPVLLGLLMMLPRIRRRSKG